MQHDLAGLAECLSAQNDPRDMPKTIIFFGSKEQTVQAYLFLKNTAFFPHYAGAYHASLTENTKQYVLQQFMSSTTEMRCLCSTIAFGMVIVIL